MKCAYKFRIYPTSRQCEQIQRTFGGCRYVYNYYLAKRQEIYTQTRHVLNYYGCCKDLTVLKQQPDMKWLKDIDVTALQSSLYDLNAAYQNFLRSGLGFPSFKKKRDTRKSYKSKYAHANIKVFADSVQLPKLGKVKCRVSKEVRGRILSATISQNPSGKYFVSLCCADVEIAPSEDTDKVCGVDLGIHDLVITSDGAKYPNNKYLAHSEKKLARLQRQLSRKSKGSNNRNKARIKVARLYEHITNQRNDTLHKLSTEIVRQNDVICIEDLAVKNLVKNHSLAKAISDAGWGEFRRQLTYKSEWYGRKLIVIDRFYPSSQLCSECGTRWAGTKDMSVREWICPNCGATHDRDVNAAKNILNEGLRLLA